MNYMNTTSGGGGACHHSSNQPSTSMDYLFSCFGARHFQDDEENDGLYDESDDETDYYSLASSVASRLSFARSSMWKPAFDPDTHHTYYWHRLTKQTTWTKPPEPRYYHTDDDDTFATESLATQSLVSESILPRFAMGFLSPTREVSMEEEEDEEHPPLSPIPKQRESFCGGGRFVVSATDTFGDDSIYDYTDEDTAAFRSMETFDDSVGPLSTDVSLEEASNYSPSLWDASERKTPPGGTRFVI